LNDERIHLTAELAVQTALLECHDPSLGFRRRSAIEASVQDLLRRLGWIDQQIYRLHDVLEGQDELTEQGVEEMTRELDLGHAAAVASQEQTTEKKAKKVTIRSFVDEDEDESVEMRRGLGQHGGRGAESDDETHELPWEGFGDESMEGDVSYNALEGWRGAGVH
jgi:hypothetical protein